MDRRALIRMDESREPDHPSSEHADAPPAQQQGEDFVDKLKRFGHEYAWFIVRNVLGWVLILASPVLGVIVPGPGGLPIFLIGFAMVTFPGKRKLTSRVLRGRRLHIEDKAYLYLAAFLSIVIPGIALWILAYRWKYEEELRRLVALYAPKKWVWVLSAILVALVIWLVTRVSLKILNGLLYLLPRFRRKFRPWMRKKGLHLLPPRRKRAASDAPRTAKAPPPPPSSNDEILELSARHQHRLRETWKHAQPWIKRVAAVAITVWIFAIMIRPLRANWPVVRAEIGVLSWSRFLLASVMFSAFLLCCRARACSSR